MDDEPRQTDQTPRALAIHFLQGVGDITGLGTEEVAALDRQAMQGQLTCLIVALTEAAPEDRTPESQVAWGVTVLVLSALLKQRDIRTELRRKGITVESEQVPDIVTRAADHVSTVLGVGIRSQFMSDPPQPTPPKSEPKRPTRPPLDSGKSPQPSAQRNRRPVRITQRPGLPLTDLDAARPKKGGPACADEDPEIFFEEDEVDRAKGICAGCAVRASCLQYALKHHEPWGVWGGMTKDERQSRK